MGINRPQAITFIGLIRICFIIGCLTSISCSYESHSGVLVDYVEKIYKAEISVGLYKFTEIDIGAKEIRIYNFPSGEKNEFTIFTYNVGSDTISIYNQSIQLRKKVLSAKDKSDIGDLISLTKPYEFSTTDNGEYFDGNNNFLVFTNYRNFCISYFYVDMLKNNDKRKIFIRKFLEIAK